MVLPVRNVFAFIISGGGNMPELEYRRLAPEEIPVLVRMRQAQLREDMYANAPDIAGRLEAYYTKHLREGNFFSWVAAADGNIVATSGLSVLQTVPAFDNPTGLVGMVSSMYTCKEFRRQGIAKKLLRYLVGEARERGCGFVCVSSSREGVFLYRDFGFEPYGNYYKYEFGDK